MNKKVRLKISPKQFFFTKNRRGQLKLSFGMIFSIFLIIIFLAFAFYVIPKFLGFQDTLKLGSFIKEFQSDIDKMWKSSQGSQEVEYNLPKEITRICFDEQTRLYFQPLGVGGNLDYKTIQHLNVANNFCIDVIDGKLSAIIKKDFNEVLVRIENSDG